MISLDPAAEAIYYQPPGSFPASAAQLLQLINSYTAAAQPMMAPAPTAIPGTVPGQVAPPSATTGWMPAGGQNSTDAEASRQQLDSASRQLFTTLDPTWQQYLALPREVYSPNQPQNPQNIQRALERYEGVANDPQYAALQNRPEFQQALTSLKKLSDVRTASNTSLQLPPPPR